MISPITARASPRARSCPSSSCWIACWITLESVSDRDREPLEVGFVRVRADRYAEERRLLPLVDGHLDPVLLVQAPLERGRVRCAHTECTHQGRAGAAQRSQTVR